jgi:hypothetical protein
VDAELDERRDPLEDSEVQRLVAEDPRRLEELERLSARLEALRERPVERRGRRVAAAAALLVVGGAAAWWLATRESAPAKPAALPELVLGNGPSRVIEFRTTHSHANGNGVAVVENGGATHIESWTRAQRPDDGGSRALAFVAVVSTVSPGIQP